MTAAEQILGLIPARGGSRGIPRKNIVPLAGRPLLAYTCDAAQRSRRLTRVVLSTDDEAIATEGRNCGVEVPFRRPPELARADTPSVSVARHAVHWLAERDGWQPDVVVLLQPTSPLRRARHIDEALDRMAEAEADTVLSVVRVPHNFSPFLIQQIENGWLRDFWQAPVPFDRFRRQSVPVLYAPNGPAVLATRTSVLVKDGTFYGERVAPYLMCEEDSIDIDSPADLRLAEWVLGQRGEGVSRPAGG
jgi:CMP-N-acetylneuraminic acid synthetase